MKNKPPKKNVAPSPKKTATKKSKSAPKKSPASKSQLVVYGQVRLPNEKAFVDAIVQVVDKDMYGENFLGETRSDKSGYYKIAFSEEQFRRTDKEKGGPDLIVRILDAKGKIIAASRKVNSAKDEENIDVVIKESGEPASGQFKVYGTITRSEKAVASVLVVAYDRDLRREQSLGECWTNDAGAYEISYDEKSFLQSDAGSADILLKVLSAEKELLAISPIAYNVSVVQEINFGLPANEKAISSWEELNQELLPLLQAQKHVLIDVSDNYTNLSPVELHSADIDFLSNDTGKNYDQILQWALSYKNESLTTIPAEAFYAWYQAGLPEPMDSLWAHDTHKLMASLKEAIIKNIIGDKNDKWFSEVEEKIKNAKISTKLDPAPEGSAASLGDLLGTISGDWLNEDKQRQFATILNTIDYASDDFVEMGLKAGFEKNQIWQVRQALHLGSITTGYTPLVKALLPIVEKDVDGRIDSLAAVSSGEWLGLAYEHGTPDKILIAPSQFADKLQTTIEKQLPTAVLKNKLESKSIAFAPAEFAGIETLLKNHVEFDITKDDIDKLVEAKIIDAETGKAAKKLQQLKGLDITWKEAEVLINTGIDTAEKIVSYDIDQYKKGMSKYLSGERLEEIYNNASSLRAISIGLLGYLQPLMYGVSANVMGTEKNLKASKKLIDSSPTLRKLFGALENCHCDSCLSVLSPSAYLADLLQFIDASYPASAELQRRRPDIYDLELSCDNAKIELPQIDLAIEILENAVALPANIPLPTLEVMPRILSGDNWPPLRTELPTAELIEGQPVGPLIRSGILQTVSEPLGELRAHRTSLHFEPTMPEEYTVVNYPTSRYRLGSSKWIVKDAYRTWTISAEEETFGFSAFGLIQSLNKSSLYIKLTGLANQVIVPDLSQNVLEQLPDTTYGIPATVSLSNVSDPINSNNSSDTAWTINFIAQGKIFASSIQTHHGVVNTFRMTDNNGGAEFSRTFNAGLANYFDSFVNQLNTGVFSSDLINLLNTNRNKPAAPSGKFFKVTNIDSKSWVYTIEEVITLTYSPAELIIASLTYQSTAADRDLFARPQNRNPLAYTILGNEPRFPWSLPYDYNLAETREALKASGLSRRSLIEMGTSLDKQFTSTSIAQETIAITQERLGLSPTEWQIILEPTADNNGISTANFWKTWGIGNATQTIRDTFIDADITAVPFGTNGLLTRVSIIIQQARLHFLEFESLLESRFINPAGISIQSYETCDPSTMRLSEVNENILAPFFDRLHRFVRLWRVSGLQIWELDLAIQNDGIGNQRIDDNAIIQIANLRILMDRLHLSAEVLITMIGGFSHHHYTNGEAGSVTPLYDRLFQNRQLINPPLISLTFDAVLNANSLTGPLKEMIAASVGIRINDLENLLGTDSVDVANRPVPDGTALRKNKLLQWIFRHARLRQTLGLSQDNYYVAWQLIAGSHFSTAENLVKFTEAVSFVNKSGFTWPTLSYVLLNASTSPSAYQLTNQRTSEILHVLQDALRQLSIAEPTPTPTIFGLTNADLASPPFPAAPITPEDRFENHWHLAEENQQWSVQEPGNWPTLITGTGIELVSRIDVLAQQSGMLLGTIVDALKSKFVAGNTTLEFNVVNNIPASIRNLTVAHLDRLEIFVFLHRTSKLSVLELDVLLDVFVTPSQGNLVKLIEQAPSVLQLSQRLSLPVTRITSWWSTVTDPEKNRVLAENIGVSLTALERLLMLFTAESTKNAWTSPLTLVEFIDASVSLKQRTDLVVQHLSQSLTIEPDLVATCLARYLYTNDTTPKTALQYLIKGNFPGLIPDAVISSEIRLLGSPEYTILLRLQKTSLLLAAWKAIPEQVDWVHQKISGVPLGFSGLIFNSLPATIPSPSEILTLFSDWTKSTALYRLVSGTSVLTPLLASYREILKESISEGDKLIKVQQVLAGAFSLSVDTVRSCLNRLEITTLDKYRNPHLLTGLLKLLKTVQGLGIDHVCLDKLLAPSSTADIEALTRKLLRTRFGDSGASEGLRKMMNQLRIQQRDRLVDYLLAKEGLHDTNALYAYYLIDVEMAPCMNTTRMLQSTAAAQLFVHRCFFNLEKEVPPSSISKARWEWMQNYRVWEANRKVFLYPENWLFPEVRDDRTETFKAFESTLNQNEPSHENGVKALRQYLDDLIEVGQISVLSMYEHHDASTTTLYLVGRLSNAANVYCWRKGVNYESSGIRWTGWERIDLELSADHIIPFVFEGDFHIAWPLINTKTMPKNEIDEFYEIRMAWAKKTSTGWTKRKTSREKLPLLLEKPVNKRTEETFHLRLVQDYMPSGPQALRIEMFALTPIATAVQFNPRLSSALITTGTRFFNRSNVFWSLEYMVSSAYIKYLTPKPHTKSVLPSEYQLAIAGIKRETLIETLSPGSGNGGRIDLWNAIRADIQTMSNDFRLTIAKEADRVAFDLSTGALIRMLPVFPFVDVLRLAALHIAVRVFHPALATQIENYMNAPVYRITGNLNDFLSINQDEIALPIDRMISFGAATNGVKKLAIRALGFDKDIDLPFGANSNLPDGVTNGTSLQIIVDVLFEVNDDPSYTKAEVPLQMSSIGNFLLHSGGNDEWQAPTPGLNGKPLVITPLRNTTFWSNGYKEIGAGNVGFLKNASSDILWTSVANSNVPESALETWYVEEGEGKLLSKFEERSFINKLYPSGYTESLLYKNLMVDSIDSLYRVSSQSKVETSWFGVDSISGWLGPNRAQNDPRDRDALGYDLSMPNANYNWEVFYHAPLAVAMFLSRQHRFEDARRWFHLIFDPTTSDATTGRERFWRFLPFRNAQVPDTITDLLEALANPNASSDIKTSVQNQISAWLNDPFNPFAVARLRSSAFEWHTVIAYIKNLINWGDQLFRRDTRESINEATLLYIMAAEILGPRPEKIRSQKNSKEWLSYRELASLREEGNDYDFSNAWLSLADSPLLKAWAEFLKWLALHGFNPQGAWQQLEQLSSIGSLYFCVPPNEKLPELWDMVEDRIFKIRNCQNIEGITRSLPLYEPPIDPELLIRARSLGISIADVLNDLSAPIPHYRFQFLLQKANEFCGEVRNLGGAILSAIEKKETEHLSLLRSSHEIAMLTLIQEVKQEQIKEASANIAALTKSKNNALDRFKFLQQQLGKADITLDASGSPVVEQSFMTSVQETGTPDGFRSLSLTQAEIDQIKHMELANVFSVIAGVNRFSSGVTHLIGLYPPAKSFAEASGFALSAMADGFSTLAGHMSFLEHRASQMGAWQRRRDEWVHQSRVTAEDIRQIDKQLIALEIRKSITEKELANHQAQTDHTRDIDDYMRQQKFSGESLYGWMESQLSGLYFSAYQLAYDLAKRVEKTYRHETGDPSASFIQYGYWDNLRKGLLSGERLSQDLRRMDSAYMDRNKREFEVVKHISLRQLDPLALLFLRDKGYCEFSIPEALFDMDFPGHYFRRIKSVSVSVPCIIGPYNNVSGTLTLLSSKLRQNPLVSGNNYEASDNYQASYLPIQSIATSSGQNDSGLFELNFRDERYLPFEGAGVISQWRFTLPEEFRQFNYDTISDVILHVKYTSREGGSRLKSSATDSLRDALATIRQQMGEEGLHFMMNMKHDMPNEWNALKQGRAVVLIDSTRLPYFAQPNAAISKLIILARSSSPVLTIKRASDTEPENLTFNSVGDSVMKKSEVSDITLGEAFTLLGDTAALNTLEQLIFVVKFTV
jgi:hypothetical protein